MCCCITQSMHTEPQGWAGPHLPQPDPWQPFSGHTESVWVHKHLPSGTWNQDWFSKGWLESNQTGFQNSVWQREAIIFFIYREERSYPMHKSCAITVTCGYFANANRAATHSDTLSTCFAVSCLLLLSPSAPGRFLKSCQIIKEPRLQEDSVRLAA